MLDACEIAAPLLSICFFSKMMTTTTIVEMTNWKIWDQADRFLVQISTKRDSRRSVNYKQNRESTEVYSRWKVVKRHSKFGETGLNKWSTSKSQKRGRNQACSLLACHTRCKCSIETTRNSEKVKPGIKVMTSVKSVIGWEDYSKCAIFYMNRRDFHLGIYIVHYILTVIHAYLNCP